MPHGNGYENQIEMHIQASQSERGKGDTGYLRQVTILTRLSIYIFRYCLFKHYK